MFKKIILIITLLFLLLGTCYAFDVDGLKQIDNYDAFKGGCSTYTTNHDRFISVEKLYGNYSELFVNDSDVKVIPMGENIYYF